MQIDLTDEELKAVTDLVNVESAHGYEGPDAPPDAPHIKRLLSSALTKLRATADRKVCGEAIVTCGLPKEHTEGCEP
jgi:hypothetical protein